MVRNGDVRVCTYYPPSIRIHQSRPRTRIHTHRHTHFCINRRGIYHRIRPRVFISPWEKRRAKYGKIGIPFPWPVFPRKRPMRLGTRNERMREGEDGVERQRFHDLGGGWLETSETSIHGDGIERGRSRLFVRGKQRPSNRASAPSSSLSTVVAFRSSLPATFASPPRIDVHPNVANWKLDSAWTGGEEVWACTVAKSYRWFSLTLKYLTIEDIEFSIFGLSKWLSFAEQIFLRLNEPRSYFNSRCVGYWDYFWGIA